jgi:EAL domain-containing protein (putative c-di-GMP-specific phosphodiesterase class I)
MIGNLANWAGVSEDRRQLHPQHRPRAAQAPVHRGHQRAAHSIDLPLIAERVETQELKVLCEMGRTGHSGATGRRPAPWR